MLFFFIKKKSLQSLSPGLPVVYMHTISPLSNIQICKVASGSMIVLIHQSFRLSVKYGVCFFRSLSVSV